MRFKTRFLIKAKCKGEEIQFTFSTLKSLISKVEQLLTLKSYDFEILIFFILKNKSDGYVASPFSELWCYDRETDRVYKYRQDPRSHHFKLYNWYIKRLRKTMISVGV